MTKTFPLYSIIYDKDFIEFHTVPLFKKSIYIRIYCVIKVEPPLPEYSVDKNTAGWWATKNQALSRESEIHYNYIYCCIAFESIYKYLLTFTIYVFGISNSSLYLVIHFNHGFSK